MEKILVDGIMVSPCVGCGHCCITAPCWVAQRLYGAGVKECPGLLWDPKQKRYVCFQCIQDVVGKDYREELYIGKGCCSNLNDWRRDVKPRREKDSPKIAVTLDPLFQKFLHCMGKEWISGDKVSLIIHSLKSQLKREERPVDEIEAISKLIVHYLKGQRRSYIDDFMGGID